MKQSNLILGIGILVAIILIIGSLFINGSTRDQQNSASSEQSPTKTTLTIKSIAISPLQEVTKRIMDIL